MRMIDLLNRIVWDRRLNQSDFYIVYVDHIFGFRKANLSAMEVGGFLRFEDSVIPVHRVRQVLWKDVPVFDRSWVKKGAIESIKQKFGLDCEIRLDVVCSNFDIVCSEKVGKFVPVVIYNDRVLNCSALMAYVQSGSPLVPVYKCG